MQTRSGPWLVIHHGSYTIPGDMTPVLRLKNTTARIGYFVSMGIVGRPVERYTTYRCMEPARTTTKMARFTNPMRMSHLARQTAETSCGGYQNNPAPDDPLLWVLLAEDAKQAGRNEEAEQLIAEAYESFDRNTSLIPSGLIDCLEEEPETDTKHFA